MPYEIVDWEKLFWFLKFLIPKLIIKDPKADEIDELLNSVDLSSYGLQRVKLNHRIRQDEEETQVDPQNPNPRGAHGGDEAHDPLFECVMLKKRRNELELYKLLVSDAAFKSAMQQSLRQIVDRLFFGGHDRWVHNSIVTAPAGFRSGLGVCDRLGDIWIMKLSEPMIFFFVPDSGETLLADISE